MVEARLQPKLRRSILFVPADRPDRVHKAFASAADAVAIDLEDGVSLDRKEEGRAGLRQVMGELDVRGKECWLRINAVTTTDCLQDLLLLRDLPRRPDVVIAPKVESARDVQLLASWLEQVQPQGEPPIGIAVALESAEGFFRAAEIARSSPRLTAVLFGGGDLSGQIGCALAWEPMRYARHVVVMAATLAGVDAIDVPHLDVDDLAALETEAKRVTELGFRGKVVIHPRQVEIVNRVFTPGEDEIEWARRVLDAARQQGTGAIRVGDKMVDLAVIRRAERIMAIAEHR